MPYENIFKALEETLLMKNFEINTLRENNENLKAELTVAKKAYEELNKIFAVKETELKTLQQRYKELKQGLNDY